jgi:hypothetical protein
MIPSSLPTSNRFTRHSNHIADSSN